MLAALDGEQLVCERQQLVAEAVGEQAVVSDSHEALGQDVEEEAVQELHCIEGHDALLAAVGVIPPEEGDLLSVEGQEAMVGYGHAVGVATEIAQDMGGAAEGRLGVNEPLLLAQSGSQILEPCRITKIGSGPAAVELVLVVKLPKSVEELVAEHGAQHGNGQQEQRVAGVDPSPVVGRQSSGEDDAVDMVPSRFELHVCRTDRNPISAPSRLGSAAASSRVWELASKSRSKNGLGEVSASGFSS